MRMNFNLTTAMKKIFYAIVLATATFVGCQNVDDVNVGNKESVDFSVVASLEGEISRSIISENEDGTYTPAWVEDDKLEFGLVENCGNGVINIANAKSMSIGDDGKATFGFSLNAYEGNEFSYVACSPVAQGFADTFAVINFKDVQNVWWKDAAASYNHNDDILVSNVITRSTQIGNGETMEFKMARLNSAMKLVLKGLPVADNAVKSVTFTCEQPIAGTVKVNYADLDGQTYPIPTTLDKGVNHITKDVYSYLGVSQDVVVFLSCMPATLKAGEKYSVEVALEDGSKLIKEGVLAADLTLDVNEVTTVNVNMADAATKTKVENLKEDYVYAIGYTTAEGVTYLLDRTAVTRRPAGATIESLGLSMSANGSLNGEVPEAYCWNYKAAANGEAEFYYVTGKGKEAHLILCDQAQGVAIQSKNDDGIYQGHYYTTSTYYDSFVISEKEGGYKMTTTAVDRYIHYDVANSRWAGVAEKDATGALNFYRIQKGATSQNSLYPVVTEVANITDGTYVILHKDANGVYNALSTTTCLLSAATVALNDVQLEINENGEVVSANVSDNYKWVVTSKTDDSSTTFYQMRPYVNSSNWLWHRDNSTGMAVNETDVLGGTFVAKWVFEDHATMGLNMKGLGHTRYAVVNAGAWGTLKAPNGSIVLVKVSDSTEFSE